MLKMINKLYRKDKVTLDIINAMKTKLKGCEVKIDDLYKQIFLDYSTLYLDLKEKEMSIGKKLDDIEKRRSYIRTRLLVRQRKNSLKAQRILCRELQLRLILRI